MKSLVCALKRLVSAEEPDIRLERLRTRERTRRAHDAQERLSRQYSDAPDEASLPQPRGLYRPEVYGRFKDVAAQLEDD